MSTVTKPIILDETGKRLASALETIAIAQASSIDITDYRQIQQIVRSGKASDFFRIGDQIVMSWNPDGGETTYSLPWDVVDFGSVTDGDGVVHSNAMWLQSHYGLTAMQFDGNEAFYVPTAEMPAGTYCFTLGNNLGSYVVSGKIYKFTTTAAVPANGQLVLGVADSNISGLPDTPPADWRVRTFASGDQLEPTEILTLTEVESSEGTDLGTLSSSTVYGTSGINNIQRSAYGYNRWSQSAVRQWLNSDAAAESWWEQKNPFDHRPDQLASVRGFMAGLPSGFLDIVNPVKVTTALNTVTDSAIGASEDTIDKFFLPSLQQEYCAPMASNVEGTAWAYWVERLNGTQHAQQTKRTEHIRYDIVNHSAPRTARLRSAHRDYAYNAWYVYSSGSLNSGGAAYWLFPAPACVIF